MAMRKYRATVHAAFSGGANIPNLTSATLKWALVDSAITPANTAVGGHAFLSDISAGVIATSAALSNQTFVDGVLDADDGTVLTDGGGGASGEYLVLYADTGNAATSRLIVCSDDATGLPLTLDGVNDSISYNASGITKFG